MPESQDQQKGVKGEEEEIVTKGERYGKNPDPYTVKNRYGKNLRQFAVQGKKRFEKATGRTLRETPETKSEPATETPIHSVPYRGKGKTVQRPYQPRNRWWGVVQTIQMEKRASRAKKRGFGKKRV